MARRSRIVVGALVVAAGLTGTLIFGPAFQVTADQGDSPSEVHETMDAMMDTMHGPGTADRMHQVPGGEEMMDHCAAMMAATGNMMGGGMMGGGIHG